MTTVYETLERPLVRVISDMERTGIKVDRTILSRLSSSFAQSIARLVETGEVPWPDPTVGQDVPLYGVRPVSVAMADSNWPIACCVRARNSRTIR